MGICAIIFASYLSMIANSNCNAKLATRKHIKKMIHELSIWLKYISVKHNYYYVLIKRAVGND